MTGVVQEQHEHAVRKRVGDAALCLVNREAAQPLIHGEGPGHQQQYLGKVFVCLLVGILSRVNHRGLHHG